MNKLTFIALCLYVHEAHCFYLTTCILALSSVTNSIIKRNVPFRLCIAWPHHCNWLLRNRQFDIPKGHCSERFLYRKLFIPKSFYSERSFFPTRKSILEVHHIKWFNPEGSLFRFLKKSWGSLFRYVFQKSLFRKVFIPKDHYSERSLFRKVIIPKFGILIGLYGLLAVRNNDR